MANNALEKLISSRPKGIVIKKKVTRRDVDKWEVARLNFNIEPCSKPSLIFEKIEEKRKIQHEKALKQLAHDLQEVNFKTEKNIMLSSMEVKSCMKLFNDQLQEILKSIDIPEVTSYDNSVFLKYQNQANNFKLQQRKIIDELHTDLNKFEDERAVENEKLFHVACEEIRKVGYFLPNDVQTFIEHEALKMNQLSLNNRRCYDDLKLTLSLLTAQTFKQFMDKIFCIKDKWMQLKLQEDNNKALTVLKKRMGVQVRDAYYRLELKGRELPLRKTRDQLYTIVTADVWLENVYEVVNILENNAMSIIDVYKKMLKASYNLFDSDFEEIKKEIEMIERIEIEDRVIKPLIIDEDFDQFKESQNLEVCWQEILFEIKPHLEDVMEFLFAVSDIWEKHMERICESKILILKALEKEEEEDQTALEDLEVKLNIALDNLRQESDIAKLEKIYNEVVEILNTIKAKYESNYLRKIATVEDYYKMTNLEADVLSAGLREFLHQSRTVDSKILYFQDEENQRSDEKNVIFRIINLSSQLFKSIAFWKEGVRRALKNLSKSPKKFLEPQADDWVEKKVETLADQMSTQIELVEKRFERVRVEFYEKRLAEIENHRTLFNEHREGVRRIYAKMREDMDNLTQNQMKELDEIEKSFALIEKNAKFENHAEVISSSQIMLEQRKGDLIVKFRSVYEGFRVDAEAKMNEMKHANVNFMKSIKLFHEGGKYSAEEGKTFATQLEAVDKEINNEYRSVIRESTREESELVKKGSAYFAPTGLLLNLLHDETLFYKQVRERICDFTIQINDHVQALLDDFISLKKLANCFFQSVKNTGTNLNDDDFWLPSFQTLYKNVCNLFYPLELPRKEPLENKEEEEPHRMNLKVILSSKETKPQTHQTTDAEIGFMFRDFKIDLFNMGSPPPKDGTFMAVISNLVWEEMDALQKIASKFYKKAEKRKIMRDDLIPATYDEFASGVLSKFQKCNCQCEELWLETILDFLPILGRMKMASNHYLNRRLTEYRELAFRSLSAYEDDFVTCLRTLSSNSSKVFRDLENKLLPLHGNPRNQNLLSDLEEEVVRRTAVLGIQWNAAIELFQNQLKCFRLDHVVKRNEINKILSQFVNMKDILFIKQLSFALVDLILGYVNKGGFCTWRNPAETKKLVEQKDWNLPCERMLSDCKLKIGAVGENVDVYLKKLKDLIENELSNLTDKKQAFTKANQQSEELNLLLSATDPEESVLKTLEPLIECIKKSKSFAESNTNVHDDILFKWLNSWKFNVKKIQRLYTFKYSEKPGELVQLPRKG